MSNQSNFKKLTKKQLYFVDISQNAVFHTRIFSPDFYLFHEILNQLITDAYSIHLTNTVTWDLINSKRKEQFYRKN